MQSTSCPVLDLAYLCVCLLGTCFFTLFPFPGARAMSVICQPAATVSKLWLFSVCSSMLQSHLTVGAQGLSCVVYHLCSFPTSGSSLSSAFWELSCHLFSDGSYKIGSLPLPPSLVCFQQPLPPPLCTTFLFHCLFSIFFCSLFRGLCWCIPGVAEGYHVMLGSHLFGLPKVSQASLEMVGGSGVGP
jgi:hypothetical protein